MEPVPSITAKVQETWCSIISVLSQTQTDMGTMDPLVPFGRGDARPTPHADYYRNSKSIARISLRKA
ncbi:hypothetical protein CI238_12609 [Colletotrichum incanum]|uniref:Uncharacterized protein n=1 Tax=Colletotrichum incanum TaxID=1573173 RepID=A0A167CW42_COLIC|nr:hypothetical protein CI238_12609 [Colletotrichum incanum]